MSIDRPTLCFFRTHAFLFICHQHFLECDNVSCRPLLRFVDLAGGDRIVWIPELMLAIKQPQLFSLPKSSLPNLLEFLVVRDVATSFKRTVLWNEHSFALLQPARKDWHNYYCQQKTRANRALRQHAGTERVCVEGRTVRRDDISTDFESSAHIS